MGEAAQVSHSKEKYMDNEKVTIEMSRNTTFLELPLCSITSNVTLPTIRETGGTFSH